MIRITKLLACSVLALLFAEQAQALSKNRVDINQVQVESTSVDSLTPAYWGLNESEWSRYLKLMEGAQANWTPDETPTFVLGLNARNATEMRRYAELEVEVQKRRQERTLAFGKAYAEAWRRLYPDWTESLSRYALLPAVSKQNNDIIFNSSSSVSTDSSQFEELMLNGDSLVVFITAHCFDCTQNAKKLIDIGLKKNIPVNLFFRGMQPNEAIAFARAIALPPQLTKDKRVTINTNQGVIEDLLSKLRIKSNETLTNYYMTRGREYVALNF